MKAELQIDKQQRKTCKLSYRRRQTCDKDFTAHKKYDHAFESYKKTEENRSITQKVNNNFQKVLMKLKLKKNITKKNLIKVTDRFKYVYFNKKSFLEGFNVI